MIESPSDIGVRLVTNPLNPVLVLTHNNLVLTRRCVESVKAQDIPTMLTIFDNGSTDGTKDWIRSEYYSLAGAVADWWDEKENVGVSAGWNRALDSIFAREDRLGYEADHCLVIGNDTVLPSWFYRVLLAHMTPAVGLLTGIAVDNMKQLDPDLPPEPLVPHPDFSAFLLARDAWDVVGPFNKDMVMYAQDCDWHIRAHRLGVNCYKLNIPFYHESSSTIRLAPEAERTEIEQQANRDREVFREIYGCLPGTAEYEELFTKELHG